MQSKLKSIFDFTAFFNDKEACIAYFIKSRWPNGIICPHCNHTKIYTLKIGYKCANNICYKKFNPFTKTPLQNTKLALKQWYMAKYLLATSTYGVSSYQLAKKLDIRQPTAWHLRHRISEFFKEQTHSFLSGVVQLDEAVIGGRNQFRHWDKKYAWSKGQAGKDKTWVFGMVKNDERYARLFVVPNRKANSLKSLIVKHIESASTLVTDDYLGYKGLWKRYDHKVVKIKKQGQFQYKTDDGYHTNRIEGLWTHLKRAYKGVYHHMSRKHLQRYCDEVSFRYKQGNSHDFFVFERLMNNIPNVVLRYDDLVGKNLKKAA